MEQWVGVAVMALCFTVIAGNQLDINKLRVVEYKYGPINETDRVNIILRSDIPEDSKYKEFEYDQLIQDAIDVVKKEKRIRLQKEEIFIIDYSLLADDDPMRAVEVAYWANHPDQGVLAGWEVKGEKESPLDYSLDQIIDKSADLGWMHDHIDSWVDLLHLSLSNFTSSKNLILLLHCHYGKDRTGEISGAYELKYGRKSWQEVTATNWEMYDHPIVYSNQRALVWYCYHLQYHRGYSHLNCSCDNLARPPVPPPMLGWDINNEDPDGWKEAFFVLLAISSLSSCGWLFLCCACVLYLSLPLLSSKFSQLRSNISKRRQTPPPADEESKV